MESTTWEWTTLQQAEKFYKYNVNVRNTTNALLGFEAFQLLLKGLHLTCQFFLFSHKLLFFAFFVAKLCNVSLSHTYYSQLLCQIFTAVLSEKLQ